MPSSNAPVYLVLTEVRFAPILELEAYIAAIQEKLRRNGFPDFKRRVSQQLVMPMAIPENATVSPATFNAQTSYVFADVKGEQVLILSPTALSLQTTIYESFETFSALFIKVLGIIHEIIQIAYFDRIGVRYLDAVVPGDAESFDDYLVPEVIGLKRLLDGQVVQAISEVIIRDDFEQLIARSYFQHGGLVIPGELSGNHPKFASRFLAINGWHAVLDNDAAKESREDFSLERIQATLTGLQQRVARSFKKMVKLEALQKWGIA